MPVRLGMNGFGRIGRYLLRLLADDQELQITAVNARADNAALAYLFKYDSTYGVFAGEVGHDDKGIIVNGRHIAVTRCKAGEWEWERLGVSLVVETTGAIKDREGLARHLDCGARKVVISAPGKGVDAMIVMGVNHDVYDPARHFILSAASCTTNCLAPMAKALNDYAPIKSGIMATIHAYTGDQMILDGPQRKGDKRRSRAGAVNIVPNSTGAAKAIGLVIPELNGKLIGAAQRVPVPTGSTTLLFAVVESDKEVTVESINAAMKAASDPETFGYNEDQIVSTDIVGMTYGSLFDATQTMVQDLGDGQYLVQVVSWYDNENSYTSQMVRTIKYFEKFVA